MSQTLMVRFGADTSAAKRAIVDLAATVATNAISMAYSVKSNIESVQSFAGVLQKLPDAAKMAAGGFIAFKAVEMSLAAVAHGIEEAQKQLVALNKIGAQAQGAGVGTTFLQSWLAQAKELNVEAGALEGMLKRAREASTLKQGQGGKEATSSILSALQEQQKAGNVTKADVASVAGADSQEARIRVVLDLVQRLMAEGKTLAALDISGKMFGGDFEEKLRSGVDMVGRMKVALEGITSGPDGRIIPPEEIERGKQITATLEEARRIMADSMRPLNEDIARWSQQQAQSWADTKVSIAECVGYLLKVYNLTSQIGEAMANFGKLKIFSDAVEWMKSKGLVDTGTTIPGIDNGFEKAGPQKPAEGAPLTLKIAPKGDKSKSFVAPAAKKTAEAAETDPVDSFINGVAKSTAALKAEIETYDKSNAVKRVAMDLAKAQEIASQNGSTLTDAQTTRLREASEAASKYKDKLKDLDQQQRQSAETARYFGDALSNALGDAVFNGAKLTDIVKNLTSQFGRQALSALMTGSGSLAGLLGTEPKASAGSDAVGGLVGLLKGSTKEGGFLSSIGSMFRANGGPVRAGNTYRVNELGEEFFTPGVDGRVTPAGQGGGYGGGGVTILDQRTMAAPAPEVRAGPNGSKEIILRDAETALAARGKRGQGPLAPSFNTPGTRRG